MVFKVAWITLFGLFCLVFGCWLDRVLVASPEAQRIAALEARYDAVEVAVNAQADEVRKQMTLMRVVHPLLLWVHAQMQREAIELPVVTEDGTRVSGPADPPGVEVLDIDFESGEVRGAKTVYPDEVMATDD